jgi:hypothetical protein
VGVLLEEVVSTTRIVIAELIGELELVGDWAGRSFRW